MLGMRRGLPSSFMRRDAELAQDLRADAVGAQVHAAALGRVRGARGARRTARSSAAASSPQFSSTATPRSPLLQRGRAPRGSGHECVAAAGVEQVEHRQRLVHAHQHLVVARPAAARQRQVQAAGAVAVGGAVELAVRRERACARRRARSAISLRLRCSIRSAMVPIFRPCSRGEHAAGRAGAPSCRRRS